MKPGDVLFFHLTFSSFLPNRTGDAIGVPMFVIIAMPARGFLGITMGMKATRATIVKFLREAGLISLTPSLYLAQRYSYLKR